MLVGQDDCEAARLGERLASLGHEVCRVAESAGASAWLPDEIPPDLALIELWRAGEESARAAASQFCRRLGIAVVFVVAAEDTTGGNGVSRDAANDPLGYLWRPFSDEQLDLTIRCAMAIDTRMRAQRDSPDDLRQRIEQLEIRNRTLTSAFDSLGDGMVVLDQQHATVLCNATARRLCPNGFSNDFGRWAQGGFAHPLEREEEIGCSPSERSHTRVPAPSIDALADHDVLVPTPDVPDGGTVHVTARPLTDAHGQALGTSIALRDVSRERALADELKDTTLRLERQTAFLQDLLDCISDGVVVADQNGEIVRHNPGAERILGAGKLIDLRTEHENPRDGVFFPDCTTRAAPADLPLERAMAGHSPVAVDLFVRNPHRPEGEFISGIGRPLQTRGTIHGAFVVYRDVTRQKQTTDELEQTTKELRYRSDLIDVAFQSIGDGIVVVSECGNPIYANPAAEQILGVPLTKVPLGAWADASGPFLADQTAIGIAEIFDAIRTGKSVDEEDICICTPGRPEGVFVSVTTRPLLTDSGTIRGTVIAIRDITQRVLAANALTAAFAEGKLEIVDTIVHNIGNAITSVTTGIETLRRAFIEDPFRRRITWLADAITAHRHDLISFLQDDPRGRRLLPYLLTLSSAYSERADLLAATVTRVRERAHRIAEIVRTQRLLGTSSDRKDVDLRELLSAPFKVLRDSLANSGIRTYVDTGNAPREICVRESHFQQMLINLVMNSVEAIDELTAAQGTDQPLIAIRTWCADTHFNLKVCDSGVGLKTNHVHVLLSHGYTTKPSGTGLGLHSVANYVLACGGRVRAQSDGYGKGTSMHIVMPLSAVLSERSAAQHAAIEAASGVVP